MDKIIDDSGFDNICMQCTFVIGSEGNEKEFHCNNKQQLADSSDVFQAMFFGPLQEKGNKIYIPDVKPEFFQIVMQFIEIGHVTLESAEIAFQLLYVTKKYLLNDLKLECFKRICKDLNVHNTCNFYETALEFDEPGLAEHCLEFIKQEARDIFQDASFMDIANTTLMKIVEKDDLNVSSELQVINACLRWAKHEAFKQNLPSDLSGTRKVLGPIFSLLRFLSLTPTQFAEGPAKSDLLTCEEGYNILLSKLSRSEPNPLPEYICKERSQRKYFSHHSNFCGTIYKTDVKTCLLYDPSELQSVAIEYLFVDYTCSEPMVQILNFEVDKDISIIGFEIATQSNIKNIYNKVIDTPTYHEEININMYSNDEYINTISFQGLVKYNKHVTLKFKEPFNISKDTTYEVVVEFTNSGNYNCLKHRARLIRNSVCGVNFELHQKNSDGVVFSIIFKTS